MEPITDYTTLKAAIAAYLNRSADDFVTVLIQMAEDYFNENGVRSLLTDDFTIDAQDVALPDSYVALEALEHIGPFRYGPIPTVGADQVALIEARYGATGVPRGVVLLPEEPFGGTARFTPAPDRTYDATISYWGGVPRLAEGEDTDTNWLLLAFPNIYLFGALAEAAPFVFDDDRIPVWESKRDRGIASLKMKQADAQFTGTLRRQHRTIGG